MCLPTCRLDCKENCEKAIELLNGTMLTGTYRIMRVLIEFN